jgi:hypothetical protein
MEEVLEVNEWSALEGDEGANVVLRDKMEQISKEVIWLSQAASDVDALKPISNDEREHLAEKAIASISVAIGENSMNSDLTQEAAEKVFLRERLRKEFEKGMVDCMKSSSKIDAHLLKLLGRTGEARLYDGYLASLNYFRHRQHIAGRQARREKAHTKAKDRMDLESDSDEEFEGLPKMPGASRRASEALVIDFDNKKKLPTPRVQAGGDPAAPWGVNGDEHDQEGVGHADGDGMGQNDADLVGIDQSAEGDTKQEQEFSSKKKKAVKMKGARIRSRAKSSKDTLPPLVLETKGQQELEEDGGPKSKGLRVDSEDLPPAKNGTRRGGAKGSKMPLGRK